MNRVLDKLERWIRPYAIPNLTVGIIAIQVVTYVIVKYIRPEAINNLVLIPELVYQGRWWLPFTFLAMPPMAHPIFAFFFFYLFFLMGTTLEANWGIARYNLFIFIGYIATIAAAFISPFIWPEASGQLVSNMFLEGTVFLAFATLYPDFQLLIMFLLPVKIKWLALLAWITYGITFMSGPNMVRVVIAASVLNYFMFFGRDIWLRMRSGHRRMQTRAKQVAAANRPFHTCAICGITDKTDPTADFRYCSKCKPSKCYCGDHLKNHEHVVAESESSVN